MLVQSAQVFWLLLDDKIVAEFAVAVVGAVDEAIAAYLDVEHLEGGDVGQAKLGVVTLALLVKLGPGDGDNVYGALGGAGSLFLIVDWVGAQVGVVVSLQGRARRIQRCCT